MMKILSTLLLILLVFPQTVAADVILPGQWLERSPRPTIAPTPYPYSFHRLLLDAPVGYLSIFLIILTVGIVSVVVVRKQYRGQGKKNPDDSQNS